MLTLFLALFGLSFDSAAQALKPPRANQFEIRADFSYFTTDANYGSGGGSSATLFNDATFTTMQTTLQLGYDWRKDLRFYAGGTLGWAESDDGNLSRSNSGLSEFLLGAQYWLRVQRFWLVPQVDFIYPAFRVDEDSDDTLIGEGAMRLRSGGWGILRFGPFRPFVYAGFEYRDGGRSFLLPYAIGLQFQPKGFWIQGEFRGAETVVDDADTENRDLRQIYLRQVNGGSFRYYSINPSVGEIALEAGVPFGAFAVKAGFAMTVTGANSADGWTGTLGVSFTPQMRRQDESSEEERFEMKSENYDESLFMDEGERQRSGSKHKIEKKVRKKPAVDQLLQETQRELEGM